MISPRGILNIKMCSLETQTCYNDVSQTISILKEPMNLPAKVKDPSLALCVDRLNDCLHRYISRYSTSRALGCTPDTPTYFLIRACAVVIA